MTTMIALLRGVNVGGHGKIKMAELRAVCEGMGLRDVRTYIQSGNIVFKSKAGDVAKRLEKEIERVFGIRTIAAIRTAAELRNLIARNPFPGADPKKLLVCFLVSTPPPAALEAVRRIEIGPEEMHVIGSEMFIYYPLGQGVSKLPAARIGKAIGTEGTGRNWSTVMALLAMAEEL